MKDETHVTFIDGKIPKCKELTEIDNVLKESREKSKEEWKAFFDSRADMIEAIGLNRPDTIGLNLNLAKHICNLIFPRYHNQEPTAYHKKKLAEYLGVKKIIIGEAT